MDLIEDKTKSIDLDRNESSGQNPLPGVIHEEQPMPIPNDSIDIQTLVMQDIAHRREVGIERYGTALQVNNGRDMLRDAYEEAIDLAIYLRGMIAERDLNREE